MTTTDREQKTVNYYDQQAPEWVAAHGGNEEESYWKNEMDKFHQLLASGKVLEIGSGAGKDASALIKIGFDYTGTDASSGLIKVAQKRNPQAKFINVAVEELNLPEKSFDGFWAAAVLLHIPKEKIDSALQSIRKEIKDGGIGFISLKEGDGEKEDQKTGRWFAYYQEEEFKEILLRNDFKVIDFKKRIEEREGQPNWLAYFVKAA